MHRLGVLLTALALCGAGSRAYDGDVWREQSTPHFDVRHQSAWLPKGLIFTLEEIHRKLQFNIGILNPSLKQEPQNLEYESRSFHSVHAIRLTSY